MDRSNLATFLAGQYAALVRAADACARDDVTGFGPALDSVLGQLGVAVQAVDPNPTITAGLEHDALLLTRYYALDWLLGLLAMQMDVKTADASETRSQRFTQVQILLDRAKALIPAQYAIEPGDFALGRIQLDFLEPWQAAGYEGPGFNP